MIFVIFAVRIPGDSFGTVIIMVLVLLARKITLPPFLHNFHFQGRIYVKVEIILFAKKTIF